MNHFGTYLRTHVQVIFQGRHPTLKLLLKKSPKLYKSMFQKKFYLAKIQKKTKIRPKKPVFFTKSCSLSFFSLKSSNQPYLKFPYFFQIVLIEVPKFFFLQKIVLKPLWPPFLARHLSQGRTNSKSQCGATIWAYAKRAGFLTLPEGFFGGAISI